MPKSTIGKLFCLWQWIL